MRVDSDELEEYEGIAFYQGDLFTGDAVEYQPDGTLASLFTYVDGLLDGPFREWYLNHQISEEGWMRRGLIVGIFRKWYKNGQVAEERRFDDHGGFLSLRRWDESGAVIEDVVFEQPLAP